MNETQVIGTVVTVALIAQACHEANRQYCRAIGDESQLPWDQAPLWQRESAILGVNFHAANRDASPSASHESWLEQKRLEGWKYGPVKDVEKREHPCFVPYDDLPVEQRAKDYIFKGVCEALLPSLSFEVTGESAS